MNKLIIKNNQMTNSCKGLLLNNNEIIVKDNTNIIIEYIDCKDINLKVIIENNIQASIHEYSINNKINMNNSYILKENSNLNLVRFFNNKNTEDNVTINLDGQNSHITYNSIVISDSKENYNIVINNNQNKTTSNIINKGIAINDGELTFNIDSVLPKNCKNCVLNQSSRIITLNNKKSIIKPNMYISEYDVEAKHSSIIGTFKEEDLFYLMTRGLSRTESIKLLIKGFIFGSLTLDIEECEQILKIINKYWR